MTTGWNLKRGVRWKSLLPVLGILVLLVIIFFSRIGGILRFFELREDRRQLQQEIHRLEAEKMELEEQIELLKKNDPKVIEREARKLGMIFEDETVYRLKYEAVPDSE